MASKKNSEGYHDPTAYLAEKNIEQEERRLRHLKKILNEVCELSGYRLVGTVIFMNERTGHTCKL